MSEYINLTTYGQHVRSYELISSWVNYIYADLEDNKLCHSDIKLSDDSLVLIWQRNKEQS